MEGGGREELMLLPLRRGLGRCSGACAGACYSCRKRNINGRPGVRREMTKRQRKRRKLVSSFKEECWGAKNPMRSRRPSTVENLYVRRGGAPGALNRCPSFTGYSLSGARGHRTSTGGGFPTPDREREIGGIFRHQRERNWGNLLCKD